MAPPRRYTDQAARQRAYRARQEQARGEELQAKGLPPAPALPSVPGRVRWRALLLRAQQAARQAHEEMQAYYEERSDAWQEGERAAALAEQIEQLSAVLDDLEAVEV